ncbi:AMP-binding protein [Desulfurispora thermophila]|uniref:AMP-binding protein n=1 Tax=Desulfurispora thermophila TaxID=265470 RepID=UPI00036C2AA6|nr:AMP-binding protein [Desulfurispora thermophila]
MSAGEVICAALPGQHNLMDYHEAYRNYDQSAFDRQFDWYSTGRLNIVHEAVDRHVATGRGGAVALYYRDNERQETYSFAGLQRQSCRLARVLQKYGVRCGDRVAIFLPRSPEWYIAFLGAARLGAILVPCFEALMSDALQVRLAGSRARLLVTNRELLTRVPWSNLPALKNVLLVDDGARQPGELSWRSEMAQADDGLLIKWLDNEHPLFILYVAGADGQARGVVHAHEMMRGLLPTALWVHDLKPGDVYWCTADPGWITGIAYGFLAPWLLGIPTVVRGGRFSGPDWAKTLADYRVSVWYSAPTAFRMLQQCGDLLKDYDLSNLRHILSVGEKLTDDVQEWVINTFGFPVYDTWWMSETGMNMICQLRCLPVKKGAMGVPLPGVQAAVVDDEGNPLPPRRVGHLALRRGWPAMFRGIWEDNAAYQRYFSRPPWFISGDAAYCDDDGYFYFQGRVDGVINTAGERVSPWEVERKLEEHPAVQRAGVAGKPDPLRGEIVKAYIELAPGYSWSEELAAALRDLVKFGLAAHAAPRELEPIAAVPLQKDGQVDRRALRTLVLEL